ncbi:carbohydrate ABC transporter permease [Streptosporangium sp. 'caverna']|uniref:carbohydrate ABC transporter permease n=1 Tax=Streptosporangium sp. 'caverna' TaxID=2202249 RepID=UPI001EF7EC5D|nr:sugar ABC transporter permease [Streptosporangium sp. 'caverna']
MALAFLAPALISLVVLRLAPAAISLWESLFHTGILNPDPVFVGLDNYADLFSNSGFQGALLVTLVFTVVINPVQVGLAFLLATLYTRKAAGARIWRSLVIVPIAAPPAVSAVVWSVIYRPDGLGNSFLSMLGIPAQPFLTSPHQALASIMVLLSWIGIGYWMMFLIAGINDIPEEIYEAASLDGASGWRKMWSITFPMVRRPLAFVLVADTVANFLVFAPPQILTKGGPDGSTNLLMYDLYNRAYALGDLNKAQAEVIILVLLALIVVAVQFRLLRSAD